MRKFAALSFAVALLFSALGVCFFVSWKSDREILEEVARDVTQSSVSVDERVRVLNSWVYRNGGFAKNTEYFVLPRLGPTPLQVLEYGGDCADKSRLLSALLAEIGIDSTLAMLYPCENCPAGHTVVEARYDEESMVLDPVYNIDFPDGDGGFLGLDELARNHNGVIARVRELRRARGSRDKINGYDYEEYSYRHVRTVNWDKNWMTRTFGGVLRLVGFDPYRVRRPHTLEDPKRFLMTVSFLVSLLGFVAAILFIVLASSKKVTPPEQLPITGLTGVD